MKETFARNKVLSILVIILLLTNILLLVFFVWAKPGEPHRKNEWGKGGDVMQILEKQVGFSADQMAQYKQLKDQHWERMKPYFGEMRTAKDNFYKLLNASSVTDSAVNAAADTIAAKQKQIDLQTFRHFTQVRDLCTPEQRPAFDSLVQQVVRRMSGPWRKGPPSKEDSLRQSREHFKK